MFRRVGWRSALLLCSAMIAGCGRAPSIGLDKESFTTVDALYSAVSLKDERQLGQNAATLDRLHEAGRLPNDAHKALAKIIAEAKSGDWASSREHLRDFMLDQRGDADR